MGGFLLIYEAYEVFKLYCQKILRVYRTTYGKLSFAVGQKLSLDLSSKSRLKRSKYRKKNFDFNEVLSFQNF